MIILYIYEIKYEFNRKRNDVLVGEFYRTLIHFLCKISKKETTVNDYSAVITGLLLGLSLPPSFPLWMAFVGGIIGIALGKYIFGGLGYNVFNPALVARAVLQAAFPVAITTWHPAFLANRFSTISGSIYTWPFMEPQYDAVSGGHHDNT